ncbi:MAG: hypothetical protein K2M48_02650 [Clostridiales bacterium]|nr:hypothetical protein [Clostridiales bacterium]
MKEIICSGCNNILNADGTSNTVTCEFCHTVNSVSQHDFNDDVIGRLKLANEFRRIGKFDEAQREFDDILDKEETQNFVDALFGCVLNYYEVTDYKFSELDGITVESCTCHTTDNRPVDENPDANRAVRLLIENNEQARYTQLCMLFNAIEEQRKHNIKIKNSIPRYRAILAYDYGFDNANYDKSYKEQLNLNGSEHDGKKKIDIADVTHKLYDILSKKTDIFFAPKTLARIPVGQRETYLRQVIKSPAIAPMMFVVYADSFNFRKNQQSYNNNIARQCVDFAEVHDKTELVSVMSDSEPPHMMKQISVQTIRSRSKFANSAIPDIADNIYDMILAKTYSDDEDGDEYDRAFDGEIIMLDEELGLSPVIAPID